MEELSSAMNNLSVANSPAVLDGSISILINSLSLDGEQKEGIIKAILDGDLLTSLKTRLQQHDCSVELGVQLIAEMAKTDVLRQQCSSVDMIKLLITIMSNGNDGEATQACRALGNICFDNDIARIEVCEERGVEQLFDLLRKQLNVETESAAAVRKVACGFLFNLTNTHESLIEKALSLDVLRLLSDYLKKFSNDENLLHMILLAVGSFGDSEAGRLKFIEYGFVKTIAGLLESEKLSIELQETILDLFANLAETDDIKLLLASPDIFNILLNLMKKPCSPEDRVPLENVTSDLIVLILTGDESMKLIYDNGHGKIVAEAVEWMKLSSEHLQNSGALAIGNMARSDEHCVQLVQSGITNELLAMLERHPVDCGSSIIHHAAFSALRNLAIPAVNKQLMLQCQLIERVLPYADTPMSTVLFKLLGTLRMLIDGQESTAIMLGTNVLLMQKLAGWCNVEDHQGVRGEANRLLASLVKNSRSTDVMKCIASEGALKNLVDMSAAEHVLMQNEALIALNLIAASLLEIVSTSLVESNLVSNLKNILAEKNGPVELLRNTLTLTKQLSTQDQLNHCLVTAGFPELMLALQSHSDEQVQVIAKGITFST